MSPGVVLAQQTRGEDAITRMKRKSAEARTIWGISRRTGHWTQLALLLATLLFGGREALAAFTEPRLALLRVTAYHAASGAVTLTLEGSFSFADAVQLGLPLNVVVTQGQLSTRFDLAGNVFTKTGAGPEQPAVSPGLMSFTQRQITVALPTGFSNGTATAQVIATYEGQPIASNRLGFTL
jgi:hypothetical protein